METRTRWSPHSLQCLRVTLRQAYTKEPHEGSERRWVTLTTKSNGSPLASAIVRLVLLISTSVPKVDEFNLPEDRTL